MICGNLRNFPRSFRQKRAWIFISAAISEKKESFILDKKSDISIGIGTAHILEPNWIELENSLLIILVDEGDDGTIDDTLRLQNDLTGIHDHGSLIPGEYKLYQNYPNPFNPTTTLRYQLPIDSRVRLAIYNVLGQVVASLFDDEQQAGYKSVAWNASSVASGIYFYRLDATSVSDPIKHFTLTRKMLLLK